MNTSKVEQIDFFSEQLGKEISMLVYLPDGYNHQAKYPVLYFLHGRSGDENIMFAIELNLIADKMIENGEIQPIIIVCPRIENSRGINSSPICGEISDSYGRIINVGMYEDYFIGEVIPLIDAKFSTIRNRAGRFVGGASGGGYAALHYVLRHQDMFSKVGGHMPAIELTLEDDDKPFFTDIETWQKYDPINIARNNKFAYDLEVYLDCGDKDEGQFYEGCAILHQLLTEQGINSQNYIFPGNHSVAYIQSNIAKYLKFYGI